MVDSVISKLLTADSALAAQEAKLIAQLKAIQAKRDSLKAVLEIFDADTTTAAPSASVMNDAVAAAQITEAAIDPPTEKPAKGASRRSAKATKDKSTQPPKTSNRPKSIRRGWQKYMRDEYIQAPLPDVVSGILKAHPKKVFEIAEVVNTIVVKDIPHSDRKSARNRISNLLAEGARKEQWHRPKAGGYRFSK